MEEKERYEYFFGTNTVKDNKTNQFYACVVDLLNQQDKRIKELEQENQQLKLQVEEMQNKKNELISKYRYWRGECCELKKQLEELEASYNGTTRYLNATRRQLLNLPKKIVEDIKIEMSGIEDILINCGNGKEDALSWFNKILQTILKKY